ncbi:MAG: hypothetical protein EGR34_09170, partial [Prevotella sp.]|nr:hypothetical protein [Prevotella sp.]
MIFRLNIRICFKSGAKILLFCRKSAAIALNFVVNQGQGQKRDLFYVLDIFTFIKQKTDKLIRDIRDFSFIIDCQQINDNGISF